MRDSYYLRYASLNFKPARRVAGIIKSQKSAKFRLRVFGAQIAEFSGRVKHPKEPRTRQRGFGGLN
jgi:hypothetical protein